ncbi:unnamed protein product [Adineta steineri]|uniref:Uncharacterized protein n=1 Tax=Adineta steineri TaxID=433720 RepID=A0A819I8H2_9BILA|nr:unnamed protein product [Adineta steineri]CAF3912459.1 unnamed protein product [Adineta steineri]
MATEINITSSNTQIPVGNKNERLCMIIKISLTVLMIALTVTPPMIVLTLKIGTITETEMNITVSTDITPLITKENHPISSVTKPIVLQIFRRTNEVVYAIWNTIAGGDSSPSLPGQSTGTYWPSEPPEAALDGNLSSEYTNHGICSGSSPLYDICGIKTGFYITFKSKPFILVQFRIATNKDSQLRDPKRITIEGSNNKESDLIFGRSWTLIYDGDAGLAKNPGRRTYGDIQTIRNNSLSFASYRILITSKRGKHNCVSYSEFAMIGRFPD